MGVDYKPPGIHHLPRRRRRRVEAVVVGKRDKKGREERVMWRRIRSNKRKEKREKRTRGDIVERKEGKEKEKARKIKIKWIIMGRGKRTRESRKAMEMKKNWI